MQNTVSNNDKPVINNGDPFFDSEYHTDKCMSLKKDSMYHNKTKEVFQSTINVDDKERVYDANVEWICIKKIVYTIITL